MRATFVKAQFPLQRLNFSTYSVHPSASQDCSVVLSVGLYFRRTSVSSERRKLLETIVVTYPRFIENTRHDRRTDRICAGLYTYYKYKTPFCWRAVLSASECCIDIVSIMKTWRGTNDHPLCYNITARTCCRHCLFSLDACQNKHTPIGGSVFQMF